MLYSCQTCHLASRLGINAAVDAMLDAGYPALDISLFSNNGFMLADDWRETAKALRAKAETRGAVFNQAHAPFGGGYEHYTKNLIPTFPRTFEFCEALGVRQIVVHPLQQGRYYGRERELFDMNMDFYRSLIPFSDKHGIKIIADGSDETEAVEGLAELVDSGFAE